MEITQPSFKDRLAFGKEGEHEVAQYFMNRGFSALTLYQFDDLKESPKIFALDDVQISPDLLIAKPGRIMWVEVKTKQRWIQYLGCLETGCNEFHYMNYVKVRELTGIQSFIVFNHKKAMPCGRFVVDIDKPYSRRWNGINEKTGEKINGPMVLWRMDSLIQIYD